MSADTAPSPQSPTAGLVIALIVPGGGFFYMGRLLTGALLGALVPVTGLVLGLPTLAVLLHLYQAIAAWNELRDRAAAVGGPLVPEPEAAPDVGATMAVPAPEDLPTQRMIEAIPAAPPELDAEGFLLELRSDWEAYAAGQLSDDEYEERKRAAMECLRIAGTEDGDRVLETLPGLVAAGVLAPEEGAQLEERIRQG
jgi:hypothetical protein